MIDLSQILDGSIWDWSLLGDATLKDAVDAVVKNTTDAASDIAGKGIAKFGREYAVKQVTERWAKHTWKKSAVAYRKRLHTNLNTTKILGKPDPIQIESIYTDVYLLDKPSAQRAFSEHLETEAAARNWNASDRSRTAAVEVARRGKNLFILGRPGAGKSTLLKYLALLCCRGEIERVPIFVALKSWSDSGLSLVEFIEREFDDCGFPNAGPFVATLLKQGKALVLLDGLDEVGDQPEKRKQAISAVTRFATKYSSCQFCLTCRTASTDYSFEHFNYVEVADFSLEQQESFIKLWYGAEETTCTDFLAAWNKRENSGIRDLGRTPLLLTLICLGYQDSYQFPVRQVDLFQEAVDALLKKWDASRSVKRPTFYRNLSHSRRLQLLEVIAARMFFDEKIIFSRQVLGREITNFIHTLPSREIESEYDADVVIQQTEEQHGLIVERASNWFSFSHLSIQEYLASRYIVENQSFGTSGSKGVGLIDQVAKKALTEPKWREVAIFVASQLSPADSLLSILGGELRTISHRDPSIRRFVAFLMCRVASNSKGAILLPRDRLGERVDPDFLSKRIGESVEKAALPSLTGAEVTEVSEQAEKMMSFLAAKEAQFNFRRASLVIRELSNLTKNRPQIVGKILGGHFIRPEVLTSYLYGCRLLVECLEVSLSTHRAGHLDGFLSLSDEEFAKVCAEHTD